MARSSSGKEEKRELDITQMEDMYKMDPGEPGQILSHDENLEPKLIYPETTETVAGGNSG